MTEMFKGIQIIKCRKPLIQYKDLEPVDVKIEVLA